MQNFANYLGSNFPTKKFIILNWEGDNALYQFLNSQNNLPTMLSSGAIDSLYSRYTDWINTRAAAVHTAGKSNVKAGVEFNMSWRAMLSQNTNIIGADCSYASIPHSVVKTVLPSITSNVDYLSFSSYDQIHRILHGTL